MISRPTPSIDEVFFAAMERESPEARAAYLDEVCASDPDLRRRVERLLNLQPKVGSFLDSPAAGPTLTLAPPQAMEGPGTVIGSYKLLEQIGEGGMGVVYMAEQLKPLRRKVALKIIKPGMDTRQVITRFEAERQALAMMEHPNIAKVHDAGKTDSGRPYFVMELVRGIPITEYCDQHRVPIPERLDLFKQVCQAVQHAHQKGIIHRDIKPTNVLVTSLDGVPVPRIIHFGIAKATGQSLTDKTLFTGFAQLIGTPLYMSPEQAELSAVDIDTRSDIYSLGVLLYELLTGTTPFDQHTFRTAALDEVRRIIREQEPPKPSTRLSESKDTLPSISAQRHTEPARLTKLLRGELDWIVMKALEKDRRRRYETANGLARDVERYLAGDPVEAGPPSGWYRLRKFVRRNRAIFTTAGLVGLILTLAVVGLSIGLVLITRERNRAVLRQHQAEQRARWVLLEVTKIDQDVSEASLLGDFRLEPWQREFIERALIILEKYVREFGDNSDSRYETAVVSLRLGRVQQYLGRFELAEAHFASALPLWEVLVQRFPADPDCLLCLAGCLMNLGHLEYDREPSAGEPYYRRALLLNELLADRFPDYPNGHLQLANCLISCGRVHERSGRPNQAEVYYRRALPILIRPTAEPFERLQALSRTELLSATCRNLESVLIAAGRVDEVGRMYGETLVLLENLGPVSSEMRAIVRNRWAWFLVTCPDVGSRDSRRAVDLARLVVELKSRTDADSWLLLGLALDRTGDPRGSEDAFRRGIELGGDKADNTLNAFAWRLVSEPPFRTVRPTWAVQMAERAVKLASAGASAWSTLGVAYYRAGKWKDAILALEKSESLATYNYLARNRFFLAMANWQAGDRDKARSWYDKGVQWMDKNRPKHEQLIRFRAEAAELLGVTDRAKSTSKKEETVTRSAKP